jgi:hypothetical protein
MASRAHRKNFALPGGETPLGLFGNRQKTRMCFDMLRALIPPQWLDVLALQVNDILSARTANMTVSLLQLVELRISRLTSLQHVLSIAVKERKRRFQVL